MKGIILAGGAGSRLHPLTSVMSKQMLPIYNKPLIFYPIETLYSAGIRSILIITTPEHEVLFKQLLDRHDWDGLSFEFAIQPKPEGIPQAFAIGEEFIGDGNVVLILGDNLFISKTIGGSIREALLVEDATIFGFPVLDPERFGVAEIDLEGKVISIEEKPEVPKSNIAVVGLYVYPNDVVSKSKELKPSRRGELEITDLNNLYIEEGRLCLQQIEDGSKWIDTGTFDSLLDAGILVRDLMKSDS